MTLFDHAELREWQAKERAYEISPRANNQRAERELKAYVRALLLLGQSVEKRKDAA